MKRPFTIKIAVAILLINVIAEIMIVITKYFPADVNELNNIKIDYFNIIPALVTALLIWFGKKWVRNWYFGFVILYVILGIYNYINDSGYPIFPYDSVSQKIIYDLRYLAFEITWLILLYTDISEDWFQEYERENQKQEMLKIEERNKK